MGLINIVSTCYRSRAYEFASDDAGGDARRRGHGQRSNSVVVKQSSGRLKNASGELPGDETAASAAHDGKTGKTARSRRFKGHASGD